MKRLGIVFVLLVACAAVMCLLIPNFVREPNTSDFNKILNRLRAIDAAKIQWGAAHPDVKVAELSQQDLSPYLTTDFWKAPVAGEVYLIHSLAEPSEAQLTRKVEWIPESWKLRWGPEGDIQVRPNTSWQWPNKALEPTATAPSASTNK